MADLTIVEIEICLKPSSTAKPDDVRARAAAFLDKAFRGKDYVPGSITELLAASGDAVLEKHVKAARICEIVNMAARTNSSGGATAASVYLPSVEWFSAKPALFVYQNNEDGPSSESAAPAEGEGGEGGGGSGEAEVMTQYTQWNLPSLEFEGVWESLLYEEEGAGEEEGGGGGEEGGSAAKRARGEGGAPLSVPSEGEASSLGGSRLKPSLLSYAASALLFSDAGVDASLISWNHVVLLHGPPGTGKTSLCKALAQKLSIRLGRRYPSAQLIEINAHSLFSRWFSESGKLVHRLFGHIRELCEDEDGLVVLLIDEVESLTAARKAAVSGSEPSDAVRVVNAVLTAIDSFRTRKNVLLLTTSNVSEAIDVAFVDRADIKAYVGPPGTRARYDILASCVRELVRVGIVALDGSLADAGAAKVLVTGTPAGDVPMAGGAAASPSGAGVDAGMSGLLWRAAAEAGGFSGRTLRKLPLQAHAMFVRSEGVGVPTSGAAFGAALLAAVRAEKQARIDFASA